MVLLLPFTSPHCPFKLSSSAGSEKEAWYGWMQHLLLTRLLSIMDDRGKISSLCWFLSVNSKAKLHCSSLWCSKNILDIVQRHCRHCKDVRSAPAEASTVQNYYLEIYAELATGFGSFSPSTETSLSAMPLLACSPFIWGNTVAHLKGGGENWLLLLLPDWKERCFFKVVWAD